MVADRAGHGHRLGIDRAGEAAPPSLRAARHGLHAWSRCPGAGTTRSATTRIASKRAYQEAGIDRPRDQLSLFEVHDCFSVTELVTMEDLHVSPEGGAIKDVLDGFYDADGKVPCQIDGGLKCFGHPIGASGLRMIYEMYLQMQGRAGERQREQEDRCLA